jgi:phage repressor protein C with HTH and peptisase S24 domain
VDASQGFACIQAGTTKGDCAQRVFLPPGIHSEVGNRLYCLRVTGDNFRGFLNHGALLFVLPDSWREVNDGDLVLYRDAETGQAFLKRVEFADRNLILKPMNVHHKNHVLPKSELVRLERIFSVVF